MQNTKKICARSGYTLIEMLVVIAIIGMLFLVAIPGFTSAIRRNNLKNNLTQIVEMVESARNQSLASEVEKNKKFLSGNYGVFLDAENQEAKLFIDNWNESLAKQVNINYADEDIVNRVFSDGIFTDGEDSVISSFKIDDPAYVSLEDFEGVQLSDGGDWTEGKQVVLIFSPPYGDLKITGYKSGGETELREVSGQLSLSVEPKSSYKLFLDRITASLEVSKN